MQNKNEVERLINEKRESLKKEFIYYMNAHVPFKERVKDVIATDGLFYSENQWAENLNIITENGIFIPFSDILATEQWQPIGEYPLNPFYFKYIKSLIGILNIFNFDTSQKNTLSLAKNILQQGEIVAHRYTQGFKMGKIGFFFANFNSHFY